MAGAERGGDAGKLAALRNSMLAAWEDMAAAYRAVARSPEISARFDVEVRQSTGEVKHKHM